MGQVSRDGGGGPLRTGHIRHAAWDPRQTSGLEQRALTVASTEKKLEKQRDCIGFPFWLEGQGRESTGTSVKARFEENRVCAGKETTPAGGWGKSPGVMGDQDLN